MTKPIYSYFPRIDMKWAKIHGENFYLGFPGFEKCRRTHNIMHQTSFHNHSILWLWTDYHARWFPPFGPLNNSSIFFHNRIFSPPLTLLILDGTSEHNIPCSDRLSTVCFVVCDTLQYTRISWKSTNTSMLKNHTEL